MLRTLTYLFFRRFKLEICFDHPCNSQPFSLPALDEYRQTFVEGRTGIFDDVLLDTCGAITFVFMFKNLYPALKYLLLRKKS